MTMAQAVFGGLPAWLLEAYLLELGGRRGDDSGAVVGDGWRATLKPERGGAGHIGIARVTVTIEGDEASGVLTALRKKAQRGGG